MADRWALVADPGVDDAVALAVLVGGGRVPDLVVSEPGNVDGATAARNAAGLIALLAPGVPVRSFGADLPAGRQPGRTSRHGDDGLGGVADRLPDATAPGPLAAGELPADLLVTGSLAAVAGVDRIDRLVWMGGALGAGNVTERAEFNAWSAPEATDEVLRRHAAVTSVVPLDVTRRVELSAEDLSAWQAGGSVARLLAAAVAGGGAPPALVHDAVAAVAWLHPEHFGWEGRSLRCDTGESDRGVLHDSGPGPTRVAVAVDSDAVRRTVVDAVLACG